MLGERQKAEQRAREWARAPGAGPIIVIGGDGTVHEVVNGLHSAGRMVSIGVLPAGTGNDFVRNVGATSDPRVLLSGLDRPGRHLRRPVTHPGSAQPVQPRGPAVPARPRQRPGHRAALDQRPGPLRGCPLFCRRREGPRSEILTQATQRCRQFTQPTGSPQLSQMTRMLSEVFLHPSIRQAGSTQELQS